MRNGYLGSVALLVMGAGSAFGQSPYAQFSPPGPVAPPPGELSGPGVLDHKDFPMFGSSSDRVWATTEYLLWWIKGSPLPPGLVTTGSPTDANPGALGQPGTVPLLGSPLAPNLEFDPFSGFRINVGAWVDMDNTMGLEVGG